MIKFAGLATTLVILLPHFLNAAELNPYTANYTASANGLKATAIRTLTKKSNSQYQLTHTLRAEILGTELAALSETSNFELQDAGPIPSTYLYSLTGLGSETKSIEFDWHSQTATSLEDDNNWVFPVETGTQDSISYQVAMQLVLEQGQENEFVWLIADGDKVTEQKFRIEGDEVLTTGAGNLDCIKLVRVREDSPRMTTIWLAKDWGYLLARIETVNHSGLRIQLELESASVNGVTVSN